MSSAGLSFATAGGKAATMENKPEASTPVRPSREERLAAKLRENLRRRKAQARDKAPGDAPPLPKAPTNG